MSRREWGMVASMRFNEQGIPVGECEDGTCTLDEPVTAVCGVGGCGCGPERDNDLERALQLNRARHEARFGALDGFRARWFVILRAMQAKGPLDQEVDALARVITAEIESMLTEEARHDTQVG